MPDGSRIPAGRRANRDRSGRSRAPMRVPPGENGPLQRLLPPRQSRAPFDRGARARRTSARPRKDADETAPSPVTRRANPGPRPGPFGAPARPGSGNSSSGSTPRSKFPTRSCWRNLRAQAARFRQSVLSSLARCQGYAQGLHLRDRHQLIQIKTRRPRDPNMTSMQCVNTFTDCGKQDQSNAQIRRGSQ